MTSIKAELRTKFQAKRRALPDKDALSEQMFKNLMLIPEYAQARTVLYYVDVRDEVRTRATLTQRMKSHQRIAVPYCVKSHAGENTLKCIEIKEMDDLEDGRYGILEPKQSLRTNSSRHIDPADLDAVLVPGVGFDRQGGRLGHGAGYYDHFLSLTRFGCLKVGVAFACQMVDKIPTEIHDVMMDVIVTESEFLDLRQDEL